MELQEFVDRIKLDLTGNLLKLEIPDETIAQYVLSAFKEIQRYIDVTKLITVPYAPCIDLKGFKSSAIVNVYRTQGYTGDTNTGMTDSAVDPMQAQMWMAFSSGGTMYNLNNYVMNYLSYNTLLQMRNTTTTDMAFKEDRDALKLYINTGFDRPNSVTIEYIPVYDNVNQITSEYWIDILQRLSLAMVKVGLGRIRTRFTQTNALYQDDGATILQEGQTELQNLREILRTNSTMFYGID